MKRLIKSYLWALLVVAIYFAAGAACQAMEYVR
jgi:hypothetical protein